MIAENVIYQKVQFLYQKQVSEVGWTEVHNFSLTTEWTTNMQVMVE